MTDLTRRTVLATGAGGMALAAVTAAVPDAAAAAPSLVDARTAALAERGFTRNAKLYRRKRFKAHRTMVFKVSGPGVHLRMKLTDVSNIPLVTKGSNRSFELVFKARHAGPPQGTYTFRRRGFKATSLFMVPTDAGRRTYRVTVNNR